MDGEEDYRRLFDGFLQDLLLALYKPEWPASEMMLTILGSLLVKHYRSKQADITLRQACLDYLGSITARLRKDLKLATEDSDKRLEVCAEESNE
jgi:cohesin loading factor subunit SCC2